jgi:gamma-glutamyltranspeptidase/glutathione hydrolase
VATAFALAVTHPAAGNLGGGGFLVAFDARSNSITTIDFRETAPARSTAKMYLDHEGKPLPKHRAGARAAGIPGTVRGLGLAHARYGRLPWRDLVVPAERLAQNGFAVSAPLARSLNSQLKLQVDPDDDDAPETNRDRLRDFPDSVAAYGKSNGAEWAEGDILRQPDLAATLARIAAEGPDEFYIGKTAKLLIDYSNAHNGIFSDEDLRTYRAIERRPISTTYRGHEVHSMGPPSSGGIVLAQSLNWLEPLNLNLDGPRHARTLHQIAEALRRAFATRARYLGDPDRQAIDVRQLISKDWAARFEPKIGDQATTSASLVPFPIGETAEGADTTHLSTLDREGNAVALTYTLEDEYGSKAVASGAGFLLNNEMGDFNIRPGVTSAQGSIGTPPNLIVPGHRMLSSQTPTIVTREGKVVLVTGSPGGRTIPSTVLAVVLNRLEFLQDPASCVRNPRLHHQWLPDSLRLEGTAWEQTVVDALRARGHAVEFQPRQGGAHSIFVDISTGRIEGVADSRHPDSKASGD